MDDVTRDRFTFSDFRLQSGEILPEVIIAYAPAAASRRTAATRCW